MASRLSEWLARGSRVEDDPMCRATNHFHNPRRDWMESGMRDQPGFVDWRCSISEYPTENLKSAVHWATGYIQPSPNGSKVETGNQWNWDRAREYLYIYLTGRNYAGQEVAPTRSARESFLARSFQALGQVLHLLQDMAVPAHVRDDFRSHLEWKGLGQQTVFQPTKWVTDRFEDFVKNNPEGPSEAVKPVLTK